MAITIAHGDPYTVWVPVYDSTQIFNGDIVTWNAATASGRNGVILYPQADGVMNVPNYNAPFGVVIGNNEKSPRFDTTSKAEYTTAAAATDPHDGSAREYVGHEGPWSKGDQRAMVKIAVITPSTLLRAPLYDALVGVAPTLLTSTNTSSSGLGCVTNAAQQTPVDGLTTIYCRSGSNAGIYRVVSSTDTATHTWDWAMPHDIAIGDTFVLVNVTVGISYVRIGNNTTASFIDISEDAATNYDIITVTRLDLREAGKEFCEFFFTPVSMTPDDIQRGAT